MKIKISSLSSPAPDRRRGSFCAPPVLYFTAGELLCFHTTAEEPLPGRRSLFIELSRSRDFQQWDTRRLSDSPLNFSSPGNLTEVNGEYVICLQNYPFWRSVRGRSTLFLYFVHTLINLLLLLLLILISLNLIRAVVVNETEYDKNFAKKSILKT